MSCLVNADGRSVRSFLGCERSGSRPQRDAHTWLQSCNCCPTAATAANASLASLSYPLAALHVHETNFPYTCILGWGVDGIMFLLLTERLQTCVFLWQGRQTMT